MMLNSIGEYVFLKNHKEIVMIEDIDENLNITILLDKVKTIIPKSEYREITEDERISHLNKVLYEGDLIYDNTKGLCVIEKIKWEEPINKILIEDNPVNFEKIRQATCKEILFYKPRNQYSEFLNSDMTKALIFFGIKFVARFGWTDDYKRKKKSLVLNSNNTLIPAPTILEVFNELPNTINIKKGVNLEKYLTSDTDSCGDDFYICSYKSISSVGFHNLATKSYSTAMEAIINMLVERIIEKEKKQC